jgi:hypothetical protein
MVVEEEASEKNELIGEIELKEVESFTVINPVVLGQAEGRGVRVN